ncbi:MAG: protein kinase, partial [Acidobacteriota bacterium]
MDGKPLSDLIPEHGLSVEQVVEMGISLIEAIRAAHEKGVIHRDLKPANVMIDHDGRAKVLDFGLAKLTWTEADDTASALATEAMTQEGVILGTIPYMSPEQIQGNPVDRRTDFFSLGILLYEMLCGQRPFAAANTAALLSSILRDAPSPVTEHRPEVPESLQRLLQKCLEKDPLLRYQTAEEIWLDLKEIQRATGSSVSSEIEAAVKRALAKGASGSVVQPTPTSGSGSEASVAATSHLGATRSAKALRWLATLGVCGGLIGTGYVLFLADRGDAPPSEAIPAQLVHKQLTSLPGTEQYPSLSPDGEWVIYSAEGPEYQDIHLQSVGGQKSFNLTAGSESDNSQPCFSPDGTRIAFRSSRDGGGVFVMGRTGEAVRRVAADGFNPTWSPDGTAIAYSTESVDLNPLNWEGETQLWRVDVETGERVQLTATNAVQPAWSPGGGRIAYVARLGDPTRMDLASISVLGGEPTAITEDEFTEWSPEWSADGRYLYFASDRSGSMNLWRIAVDTDTGLPTGPPEPLTTPATFLAHPRVAIDGSGIAYSSVFMTQNIQQIGFDAADP